MSWTGDERQTLVSNDKNKVEEEEEEEEEQAIAAATEEEYENGNEVTSHIYIKRIHTGRSLDREVVLRQIRHRKRVHKVRAAFQSLLISPFSASPNTHHASLPNKKWIDDAFAAL